MRVVPQVSLEIAAATFVTLFGVSDVVRYMVLPSKYIGFILAVLRISVPFGVRIETAPLALGRNG